MTEPATRTPDADAPPEELVHGFDSDIETEIVAALDGGKAGRIRQLLEPVHYADVAGLLKRLDETHRETLVEIIRPDFDGEILSELDDTVLDHVVDVLGIEEVAAAVTELDSDDAVEVIEDLEERDQQQVLDAIPEGDRAIIEEALAYPEDSAGRLMQRELVTMPEYWTVGDAIDFLRSNADADENRLPDQFYMIYVVDPAHRPIGKLALDQVLRTRRPVPLSEVMAREFKTVPAAADQEDVALLFRQRDLVAAPVVDEGGRLVGAITIDDIVDVIDEEHEEDIMRLGGVRDGDLYAAAMDTMKARFSWLFVNLLTAIVASMVIGVFDATINQMVALAVLMPIVASMGGNAGTQTLTVAVRALAMKELTATNAMRVVGKEFLVGGINGILFALLTGLVAWLWFGNQALGLVIGMAMIVNMIVAGLAGTAIPLALDRAGADPAIASSVFLTTITDVVGFFVFLGLAALVLL